MRIRTCLSADKLQEKTCSHHLRRSAATHPFDTLELLLLQLWYRIEERKNRRHQASNLDLFLLNDRRPFHWIERCKEVDSPAR